MSQTSLCGETSAEFSMLTYRGRRSITMMGQSKDHLSFLNQFSGYFITGLFQSWTFRFWHVYMQQLPIRRWLNFSGCSYPLTSTSCHFYRLSKHNIGCHRFIKLQNCPLNSPSAWFSLCSCWLCNNSGLTFCPERLLFQCVKNKIILHSRKWLETDFQDLVRHQRADVASKTGRAVAVSAANGILRVLRAWNGTCGLDEVLSMGVLCPG